MKISWVILTYNRREIVRQTMAHNTANAGYPIHEIVWVDNGSTDGVRDVMKSYNPDVSVIHKTNLGVAKGYNRGYLLATGEYIIITGCDMLMPDNWLATFANYLTKIPGIACMYHCDITHTPERRRGDDTVIDGLSLIPAMPFERRMMKRELFLEIGFHREDFGLYGLEDCEWGERAEKVCKAKGLKTYLIPNNQPIHLGTEGCRPQHDGKDDIEYYKFKQEECRQKWKDDLLIKIRGQGFPYYNPYSRIEQ